ncbi:hypothetical protein F5Y09DRAFT_335731 [Xylaria sp. FL1042]|nr:hypothetical protein F5Y09DRAFT_335731 [Xylaria sp. FL1042]
MMLQYFWTASCCEDFLPAAVDQETPPPKPTPKQKTGTWEIAEAISRQSDAADLEIPTPTQLPTSETSRAWSQPNPASFVMPLRVSHFSYLIEGYEHALGDEMHASDLNNDEAQGRRGTQGDRACDVESTGVDSRDRVYIFLGLVHKGYNIASNYSGENDIREVLIETAKAIIRFDKSLDILQHVYHGRDKLDFQLPSWVPDWTSEDTKMGVGKDSEEEDSVDASKGVSLDVEFGSAIGDNNQQDLKVRGIFLDYIEDARSESSVSNAESSFFTMKSQLRVIGPKSARIDDEVWVLYGSRKPVVLRQNSSYSRAYGCLRDGTLSSVMLGGLVDQV